MFSGFPLIFRFLPPEKTTKSQIRHIDLFLECTHNNTEDKVKKVRELQKDLTEKQMSHKLPASRIISYDVTWNKESGDQSFSLLHH